MYAEIFDRDFERHAQSAELLQFLERYHAVRGERDMPDAADMPLTDFPRKLPFLMVLEPLGDNTYRYVHYGAGIAAVSRFDMTGKTTADFGGVVSEFFESVYQRARDEARPLFTIHRAVKAASVHSWERLILPLRQADGQIGFLVYNRPREFQQDFLKAVLDIIPDGVLAIRAMRNADGRIVDAAVVSANPAGLAMLGLQQVDIDEASFRDCATFAEIPDLWDDVVDVIVNRGQRDKQFSLFGPNGIRHLRARVAPLADGALLHLSDITEFIRNAMMLESEQGMLHDELIRRDTEADRLRREATADPLTGLLNRRGFFAQAARMQEQDGNLTLIVADVDHFKAINDRYGHQVGDEAIKYVAHNLEAAIGARGGIAARFGGEEFIGLIPEDVAQVWIQIEQLRIEIMVRPFASEIGPVNLTVSLGIADMRAAGTIETALQEADTALYEAKRQGRNRTIAAGSRLGTPTKLAG